jgi:hypothetical protein
MTDLYDAQIQAIRQYTGISQTWMKLWQISNYDLSEHIRPFFGKCTSDKNQDNYQNIKFYNAPKSATITKPVHDAIEFCIGQVASEIMNGYIAFDMKEIFKLKDWPDYDCNCESILYSILLEWEDEIYRKQDWRKDINISNREMVEAFADHVNVFLSSWRDYLLSDITDKLEMIGEDTDEVVEEIRSRLSQQDKSLGGTVKEYEPGKFRFSVTEGERLEFKQSVFAPNLSKIEIDPKEYPEKYNKLSHAKKREVLQDVFSSICAFLNTEGGEVYVGVDDTTRNIVGLSDDRNSAEFTKRNLGYAKFQDTYMQKITSLLKNNIKYFKDDYVSGMKFINYTEDIDIFCITCKKIIDPSPPVELKKVEFDKNWDKIREHNVLYKRIQDHDEEIESPVAVHHFYTERYPLYLEMLGKKQRP